MDILVDQDNRMTLILWDMDDYPEKIMISTLEIRDKDCLSPDLCLYFALEFY